MPERHEFSDGWFRWRRSDRRHMVGWRGYMDERFEPLDSNLYSECWRIRFYNIDIDHKRRFMRHHYSHEEHYG